MTDKDVIAEAETVEEQTIGEITADEADTDATPADEPTVEEAADKEEAAEGGEDTGETEESAQEDAEAEETPVSLVKWTDDDGKEWDIPEELTPSLMKNKDYTAKTQEVAEQRRALEAQKAEWEAEKQRDQEDMKIEAELARLTAAQAEYDKINWDELYQYDPQDAQHKQFQYGRIRDEVSRLSQEQNTRRTARLEKAQSEMTKRFNDSEAYARANIPGWEQGKDRELVEFAREVGFDDQALKSNMSPSFLSLLHKAYVGDRAQKRASEKPKPAAKDIKPATKVGAKSSPTNRVNLVDADSKSYWAAIKAGADPRLSDL